MIFTNFRFLKFPECMKEMPKGFFNRNFIDLEIYFAFKYEEGRNTIIKTPTNGRVTGYPVGITGTWNEKMFFFISSLNLAHDAKFRDFQCRGFLSPIPGVKKFSYFWAHPRAQKIKENFALPLERLFCNLCAIQGTKWFQNNQILISRPLQGGLEIKIFKFWNLLSQRANFLKNNFEISYQNYFVPKPF